MISPGANGRLRSPGSSVLIRFGFCSSESLPCSSRRRFSSFYCGKISMRYINRQLGNKTTAADTSKLCMRPFNLTGLMSPEVRSLGIPTSRSMMQSSWPELAFVEVTLGAIPFACKTPERKLNSSMQQCLQVESSTKGLVLEHKRDFWLIIADQPPSIRSVFPGFFGSKPTKSG